ncbi:MAG: SpoIID/LytB domain-containing protein [Patescibacteria group bacterium]|nr:SpoIID/LytB domain-containing protein [Patescibacteria group bacterium]MDD5490847.1 SpoIID/LytB domain-containing protein [Patescibacteria group bacterium]
MKNSEALVYEDASLRGVIFTVALAFFILIATATLLRFVENSIVNAPHAAAGESSIENSLEEITDNGVGVNPLLVINKILGIKTAHAATATKYGYSAQKMVQSHKSIELAPGEIISFQVGFKNNGKSTWRTATKNYVSIYNRNRYKDSFRHSSWFKLEQPAKLTADVKPGEVGYFNFTLQAPDIPGNYTAKFQLAAENLIWISGGELNLPFSVIKGKKKDTTAASNNTATVIPAANQNNVAAAATEVTPTIGTDQSENEETTTAFSAFKLIQSHRSPISLPAGTKLAFRVGFKNIGTASWTTSNIYLNTLPKTYLKEEIRPGQIGYFEFELSPAGSQNFNYELRDGQDNFITGSNLNFYVEVIGTASPEQTVVLAVSQGPLIRVGLYNTENQVVITGSAAFEARDQNGQTIKKFQAGETATATFNSGTLQYYVEGYTTNSYLKFVSENPENIFTIVNFENRPDWNKTLNDNQFRGALEIRYGRKLWVINELAMEDYLKGLAETSNVSPYEYLKTMTTAARSYALWHYQNPTKHAKDYFTVDAVYDQVYRGYGVEKRMPNLVRAVEETNGQVVALNSEVVVTPYFARSDGRTRSWTEIWSGSEKSWLQSVPAPYDAGKTLWGHGVGLSAWDALYRAKEGSTYDQILKYYYQGTELVKNY